MLTKPAGCGHDTVPPLCERQAGARDWGLATGAPRVLKSVPAEAVVSFEEMVLLTSVTANASSSDTPAPSHPATLLLMILFWTWTWSPLPGFEGKRATSAPFTAWRRKPPPLPASAELPSNKLALITRPGPVPSLSPATQSFSVTLPHSVPTPLTRVVPSGPAPITIRPPP